MCTSPGYDVVNLADELFVEEVATMPRKVHARSLSYPVMRILRRMSCTDVRHDYVWALCEIPVGGGGGGLNRWSVV